TADKFINHGRQHSGNLGQGHVEAVPVAAVPGEAAMAGCETVANAITRSTTTTLSTR
ncbi:hypothetical protein U1Q18_046481, partial [Sarracenia purpurea var. burkii]